MELLAFLAFIAFLIWHLVYNVDWGEVERKRWEKVRHTALTDEDFEKLQKKLDEPLD